MHLQEFFSTDLDEGIKDPGIFKAIFMAGPPGAGKNIVINALGLKAAGLKLQDIDHTLAYLNKAKLNVQHDDAGRDHSLRATRRRQTVLQQEMLGLIINTTGRDYESTISLKKDLEAVGYDTFMLFVDVEEDVAWNRAQNRTANATDPKDRNRPVDRGYFNTAYAGSKENTEFFAIMFGEDFALVDNNVDQSPRQMTAQMLNRWSEERVTVLMREASRKIKRFLARPLTPLAQSSVNAAKKLRNIE